ncbi:hypothetical protein C8A01DRAFT_12003, partial [Parachaetomium inaequale]
PPTCYRCRGPSTRLVTQQSNRNGNAGRPYHKCQSCGHFLGFADDRGNYPNNPLCDCGVSSKAQAAGKDKMVPRDWDDAASTCNTLAETGSQSRRMMTTT